VSTPDVCKLCGNGKRETGETCDDGNTTAGDGCSTVCAIELGWTCNGAIPDACGKCGNGFRESIEECDDGNSIASDGCTLCKIDPYYVCYGGSPSSADTCDL
jgi:cysteine-rich repeat protein